jgi:hypothetical protein
MNVIVSGTRPEMNSGQSEKRALVRICRLTRCKAGSLSVKLLRTLTMQIFYPIQQAEKFISLPAPDAQNASKIVANRLARSESPEFMQVFLPHVQANLRDWSFQLRAYLNHARWDSQITRDYIYSALSAPAESRQEKYWRSEFAAACFQRLQLSGQTEATWASILEEISGSDGR